MSLAVQSLWAADCCDYHALLVAADSSNPQRFPPQGFRPGKPHPLLKAKRRGPEQRLPELGPSLRAHTFCFWSSPLGFEGTAEHLWPPAHSSSASFLGTKLKSLLPAPTKFLLPGQCMLTENLGGEMRKTKLRTDWEKPFSLPSGCTQGENGNETFLGTTNKPHSMGR